MTEKINKFVLVILLLDVWRSEEQKELKQKRLIDPKYILSLTTSTHVCHSIFAKVGLQCSHFTPISLLFWLYHHNCTKTIIYSPNLISEDHKWIEMPEQSNDYRVVVFGAGGVGKSSLVLRFVKGKMIRKFNLILVKFIHV